MAHSAKILLDSISSRGYRLTTFEIVMPRIILSEWNTHRMFTRSSASSRAIPVAKTIERVMTDPYIPTAWGKNQKGMSAAVDILGEEAVECERSWLSARDVAVGHATNLMNIGVHKQLANRLLEPFMWHTVLNSATEYSNFFGLRDDKNAHPDIQIVARMMRELYDTGNPTLRKPGEWHAPYAKGNDELGAQLQKITTGRAARVSYLNHNGEHSPADDIRLHDQLLASGHMSPFEHAARPMTPTELEDFCQKKMVWDPKLQQFMHATGTQGEHLYTHFCGNYNGWVSYRKEIPLEDDYGQYKKIHNIP